MRLSNLICWFVYEKPMRISTWSIGTLPLTKPAPEKRLLVGTIWILAMLLPLSPQHGKRLVVSLVELAYAKKGIFVVIILIKENE